MDATTMEEQRPMTIPELARRIGWSPARLRRHLTAKNDELDGQLLVNVGRGAQRPRWTVTLAAMKWIAPQWFRDPESTQRQLDWLTEQLDDAREDMTVLSRRVSGQHAMLMTIANRAEPRRAGDLRRTSSRCTPTPIRATPR